MVSDAALDDASDLYDRSSILPPDPVDDDGAALETLHDREYRVRAFRRSDQLVLIRGAVRDQKPPGLYIEDDPRPLTIHHMQLDMEVAFPSLEIVSASVVFEAHPNEECPAVIDHYGKLVGLSIARGFTHRVRELFGGPRGCTHTTALLQAMAPVAVQCFWSLHASAARRGGPASSGDDGSAADRRRANWQMNLNTCHVWAEGSEHVEGVRGGEPMAVPLFMRRRLDELGVEPSGWGPWAEE
jgi:hypothetical protein